jgi:hypothetical protein
MGSWMLPPAGEATRTILRLMAVVVVFFFLVLLVEGFTGIELFVMLGLILALTGIQYLIDKFLLDNYRQ